MVIEAAPDELNNCSGNGTITVLPAFDYEIVNPGSQVLGVNSFIDVFIVLNQLNLGPPLGPTDNVTLSASGFPLSIPAGDWFFVGGINSCIPGTTCSVVLRIITDGDEDVTLDDRLITISGISDGGVLHSVSFNLDIQSQCSNAPIDDDGDGFVDIADPGCHSDGNPTDPSTYVPNDNNEASNTGLDLTITADGRTPTLRVTPEATPTIEWSATDVQPATCAVTGTNEDGPWAGQAGSNVTSPITEPVNFTLSCRDLNNQDRSASVLVTTLPVIIEF